MTSEHILNFISQNPFTVSEIEKMAGLPRSTIQKALNGGRVLKEKHITALEPILRNLGYVDPKPKRAKVFAIINHKGGVGKTTTCINLGAALAEKNHKVLVVDMDSQGNLSQCLGVRTVEVHIGISLTKGWRRDGVDPLHIIAVRENLDLVPTDFRLATVEMELTTALTGMIRLRDILKPYLSVYDYILIDCPPSLAIFTRCALVAANKAFITVEPERSAIEGINNIIDLIGEVQSLLNPTLSIGGVLLTRVDKRLVIHRQLISQVRHEMEHLPVFATEIRYTTSLKESQYVQEDIFIYNKESYAAQDYMTLAEEILAEKAM